MRLLAYAPEADAEDDEEDIDELETWRRGMRGGLIMALSLFERRLSSSFAFGASTSMEARTGVGGASGMADNPEDDVFVVASDGIETAVSEGEVMGESCPSSESGREGMLGKSPTLMPRPEDVPGSVGELVLLCRFCCIAGAD